MLPTLKYYLLLIWFRVLISQNYEMAINGPEKVKNIVQNERKVSILCICYLFICACLFLWN